VHTASPFTFSAKTEEDLVKPAVDGTLSVMKACAKHGVKRVVITSSIAAITMGWKRTDKRPKAWNE
jgi:nucleoside-diphosphate-sugar epimerase